MESVDRDTNGGAITQQFVIDLGKQTRKRVKRLRKGQGKLANDVTATISNLRSKGELGENAVPIIFVVREKPKRVKPFWAW